MKTIFLTGVSGFVGTNLVRYFHDQKDIRLIGHSRNIASASAKFKGYSIELVDEANSETWNRLGVDCIIHLAGIAHDLSGIFRAEQYENINHGMTVRLYDEFKRSKASSFIFMSSIKAAVDMASQPVSEHIVPAPVTDYGKSKRKAEAYIESTPCPVGKRYYIFRPCMMYGRGNKGNLNLLYKFVRLGIPYPLGAFQNERSFLFVENLCFIVDRFLRNNYPSGTYHLSDGKPLSTTELVGSMAAILERNIPVWNVPVGLVRMGASLGMWLHLPFNKQSLQKLTESLVVSNEKVMDVLGTSLPHGSGEGLAITLKSFNE